MKNKKGVFAALVSESGKWDVVIDVYSEEYDQKIRGRIELDWYDTHQAAQDAIDKYREEEELSLNS